MRHFMYRIWSEEDGVLSFEWVLLVTLLTIGIVSGVAAARDAIVDELGDVAQAMLALDQSYTIDFPLLVEVHTTTASSATDSSFVKTAPAMSIARATPRRVDRAVLLTLKADQRRKSFDNIMLVHQFG